MDSALNLCSFKTVSFFFFFKKKIRRIELELEHCCKIDICTTWQRKHKHSSAIHGQHHGQTALGVPDAWPARHCKLAPSYPTFFVRASSDQSYVSSERVSFPSSPVFHGTDPLSKDMWSTYVSKLERAIAAGLTGFISCSLIPASIHSTNAY